MRYTLFGETGVYVSRLCLGTMTFGGANKPPYDKIGGLDEAAARSIVDAAIDGGINFVDTADVYAGGESETLVGAAIKGRRDALVLATKFHARVGKRPNDTGQSRLHMTQALDASLKRLGTDHIDLYQIHNFDAETAFDETLRALDDAVRAGKILYYGCSNLSAWHVMKAHGVADRRNLQRFVSVQAYYSLAGRDLEHDLGPMIADQRMALMVWSPLAGGFLSGKVGRETEHGQARRDRVEFPPIRREQVYDIVDILREIAGRRGVSGAQVALAWLLAKPVVTSVIVGARRVDQLVDNMASVDLMLDGTDIDALDNVSDTGFYYPNWVQTPRSRAPLSA